MELYRITWDEVTQMAIQLAQQLLGKYIWGVPRGGQLIATLMSFHGCHLTLNYGRIEVIVDDIADTGETLGSCQQETAALIVRGSCNLPPSYWAKQLHTKNYILFPWEDEAAVVKQLANGGSFRSTDN